MGYRSSLAQRIAIAFTLMTLLVATTFAAGVILAAHLVEERLISAELSTDLDMLLKARDLGDLNRLTHPDQSLYVADLRDLQVLPEALRELGEGFHEVFPGPFAYHAIVRDIGGRRYILLQDQSDFERREELMYSIVAVGVVSSVLLAALLGWLLARRVLAPVRRLAWQVRHRDQLLAGAPPLAPDYAWDEVGQLAAAFDSTLGELRQALRRERLFTSDVSHEFRTPLMVLASSCELLQGNPGLDARGRSQVERIARACHNMQKLVETFLLLARAENQQSEGAALAPRASLAEVAGELVQEQQEALAGSAVCFEYVRQEPVLAGLYNAPFLASVMGNLLRNARHYCDSGHIRLTLTGSGFMIEDTGAGIPDTLQASVFDPFVQGETGRRDGLGLGLSLVRRICLHEGWRVRLEPVEPHGCRFVVDLVPPAA